MEFTVRVEEPDVTHLTFWLESTGECSGRLICHSVHTQAQDRQDWVHKTCTAFDPVCSGLVSHFTLRRRVNMTGSVCKHVDIADVGVVGHAESRQELFVLRPAGKDCFCVTDV